ncbi:MAG: M6 family metalloprotease domain-containing protein [Bacteroidaceae bacterium]|nr:M6 family metalloprotease domain-containing protein [Bacteroidaceae bacterium]
MKRTVTLADGRDHTLTLTGDEYCHYWLCDDGRPMQKTATGTWRELSAFEIKNVQAKAVAIRKNNNTRRARRKAIGSFQPLIGKKRGIVILVNFQDKKFSMDNPRELYNDFFNKRGYTDYGMTGSVADYFLAQSYGQFELDFDILGPYTLTQPMKFYGAPNGDANDTNAQAMVQEAVRAAAKDIDFTPYDWNGDDEVNQVFIIYAGYGQAQGGEENTIWPHEARIGEALTFNGKTISTYACSCELANGSGTTIDGIGSACHEFSHCLGLPDFYDVNYNGGYGMSTWDIMDSGSYNNDSRTPAGYTSYERWMAGWLTPTEISQETNIKDMRPIVETPEAYILYNEGNRDEYYLLENRQLVSFDAGLYGHGLLVIHVDYDKSAWMANTVNTRKSHQRMSPIAADDNYENSVYSLSGDPFPGKNKVTSLTDESTPAGTTFRANRDGQFLMHKSIERIVETNTGLISFTAMRPLLAKPEVALESSTGKAFTIRWNPVEMATSYDIQVKEMPAKQSPEEAIILEEHFTKCYRKTAGFTDIGSSLSNYLDTPGFSGSKLYQSPGYLRLGTGTENGVLRSPAMRALSTGQLTIVMTLAPFTEGTEVNGNVRVVTNKKPTEEIPFAFTTAQTIVLHPTTQLDEAFRIDLVPTSRMYISYLAFYDGEFNADELGVEARERNTAPRHVKTSNLSTTATTYTFEELSPTSTYSVIVRAREDERFSRWSDEVVAGPWTDGIVLTRNNKQSTDRNSRILNDIPFDLAGRRIATPEGRGLYIRNGHIHIQR